MGVMNSKVPGRTLEQGIKIMDRHVQTSYVLAIVAHAIVMTLSVAYGSYNKLFDFSTPINIENILVIIILSLAALGMFILVGLLIARIFMQSISEKIFALAGIVIMSISIAAVLGLTIALIVLTFEEHENDASVQRDVKYGLSFSLLGAGVLYIGVLIYAIVYYSKLRKNM